MSKDEVEDERLIREIHEEISRTTDVIVTPETTPEGDEGTSFWLYSVGMRDNHGMPEVEMRNVPSSFVSVAGGTINEINVYRLAQPENPMLFGQTVDWRCGHFIIEMSEDHDGMYSWKADEVLRLSPAPMNMGCTTCAANDAGLGA